MSKNSPISQGAYAILKDMKGGNKARGFTIVETLVVLAVTGALFTAIAITLSGRQQRTQFQQAVNEVQAQIQRVIDDVAVGYYPNPNNFRCTATLSGPSFSTSGSTEQGANTGCTFIGKVIQFHMSPDGEPEKFNVYTVAGLQRDTEGNEIVDYNDAKPKVVPSSTEVKELQYGLTTGSATIRIGSTTQATGAIGFVNSLAAYSSDTIVSGSHTVRLMPIRGTELNRSQEQGIDSINAYFSTAGYDPDTDANDAVGATICFVSAGTNQSGRLIIGNAGRELSVTLEIKGNKTCS